MNRPQDGRLSYVASAVTLLAALGMFVQGRPAQGAVLALGALFLIYWGRRLDRHGGDR